jgi:hypothetical protein
MRTTEGVASDAHPSRDSVCLDRVTPHQGVREVVSSFHLARV